METYVCNTCNEVRFNRECRDHEFVDKVIPDERDIEISKLKAKLAIAIERFEYLERFWDDGDARDWAKDVLKELSDMDGE